MITESQRPASPSASKRIATLDDDDVVPLANAYRAGELIADKYRLLRLLGEGGMGVVWLARNVALDSDVAIKMLRAGEKSDKLERRMLKEAQAVARLGHPAILRVFDFGTTHRSDPYMVMELLDGEDLAQALESKGRLSPIKAVRTLLPVLHALGTAHQKGIVHRDLKPENIFLTTTDSGYVQPKVVDFGIVKTEAPELDRLTRVGTVLGTPAYLCPEQARGEDVDQRADVWSAAVVLYEMMTCRLPFGGSNYNALMRSIIEDLPPPIMTFGTGDGELWAIIQRGLAKRAADRWPSMSAFGAALANWLLARGETDDISGASLRAAWQQGTTAARAEELYSGRPNAAPGGSAHQDTVVGRVPWEGTRPAREAQATRSPSIRLIASAGLAIAVGAALVSWNGRGQPSMPREAIHSAPAPTAEQETPAPPPPRLTSYRADRRESEAAPADVSPEAAVIAAPRLDASMGKPNAPVAAPARARALTARPATRARPLVDITDDLKTSL